MHISREPLARTQAEDVHAVKPHALNHAATARLMGIAPSHLHNLEKTGRMGPTPVRLGRCKRYLTAHVQEWMNAGCPPRHRWQAIRNGGAR